MDLFGPTARKLATHGATTVRRYGAIKGHIREIDTTLPFGARREARRVKRINDTIIAKQKGGLSNVWDKTKKVGRVANRAAVVGGVLYGGYEIYKGLERGGIKEGGKVALNQALTLGPYAIPMAGPALLAVDAARMIRNKDQGWEAALSTPTIAESLTEGLYRMAPGLRPSASVEDEEVTEGDGFAPYQATELLPSQDRPRMSEQEYRRRERNIQSSANAFAEGNADLDEHIARNYR